MTDKEAVKKASAFWEQFEMLRIRAYSLAEYYAETDCINQKEDWYALAAEMDSQKRDFIQLMNEAQADQLVKP